jgi:hypothetical protein
MKFTLLTRDSSHYLVDRYSERKESADELSKRVNQKAEGYLKGGCSVLWQNWPRSHASHSLDVCF